MGRKATARIHKTKRKCLNMDRQSPSSEVSQALKHAIYHVRDRRGQPLINIQIKAFQVRVKTAFVLTFKSLAMYSLV